LYQPKHLLLHTVSNNRFLVAELTYCKYSMT
jgi:hypothetical protein